MKVVALAGGVGGAKLVDGLAQHLGPEDLSVIVNTGDDFEYLGLQISPDLDTVCYTLADLDNPVTGWGLRDETWVSFESLAALGGLAWFRLGDKDLATHLYRTDALRQGRKLSEITSALCQKWGVAHPIYPMSDDPVRTIVKTRSGESLGFQEYFVHQHCEPEVIGFDFVGAENARPVIPGLTAIEQSDLVVLAPSNPWVSIAPILAVPGYLDAIRQKSVIAVSPIIGGKALKGPAAKMYSELGFEPSASAVANHYRDFLTGFVFDAIDKPELEKIQRWRIIPLVTDTIMKDRPDRSRLAKEVLAFGEMVLNRSQ
ncbi:MAG: 2-phospho-L-lactate transferase [Anaerolineaceae bacterium]|nr:2-phospho-L-lactate transferase [Anaerolineaceae bacterium]